MTNAVQVGMVLKTVSEAVAAQTMWEYYKEHKLLLVSDIREFKDYIHAQLMLGINAEQVFAQFFRDNEPAQVACKAKGNLKGSKVCRHERTPWPFSAE